jgi:microcystin-dependent protein
MASPWVGEIRLVGFSFAPYGWQIAAGQLLPIQQNTALFSLLGTFYGGDGIKTFALPNLQGRVALGAGQGNGLSLYNLGQPGGVPSVTLLAPQTPNHNHNVLDSGDSTLPSPAGNTFGITRALGSVYSNASVPPIIQMATGLVSPFTGANGPHNNLMSFLTLNWVIALQGVFPIRG